MPSRAPSTAETSRHTWRSPATAGRCLEPVETRGPKRAAPASLVASLSSALTNALPVGSMTSTQRAACVDAASSVDQSVRPVACAPGGRMKALTRLTVIECPLFMVEPAPLLGYERR